MSDPKTLNVDTADAVILAGVIMSLPELAGFEGSPAMLALGQELACARGGDILMVIVRE